jgi:alkylation response protein AidB-like acyl-CoA dehydrogenase
MSPPGPGPTPIDAVAALRAHLSALNALPLPGGGSTAERWRALTAIARCDLSVARLAEGHADAGAILLELDRADLRADGLALGVWAADPGGLRAREVDGGWCLDGEKPWCSGSTGLDAALVTATAADGPRLFFVPTDGLAPTVGSWQPMGMLASRSDTIAFEDVRIAADQAVSGPDAYVQRPGFGHGGCGVAACWWGGARGLLDELRRWRTDDALVALGRSDAALTTSGLLLREAADAIDRQPLDRPLSVRLAGQVRLAVAVASRTTLDATIAALGSTGLCQRPEHSTRVADLLVYLSQLPERSAAAAHGQRLSDDGWGGTW